MRCPALAESHTIITNRNRAGLLLTSYDRTPGTVVYVSCLQPHSHYLRGSSMITCLSSGVWNKPVPVCVQRDRIHHTVYNTPKYTETRVDQDVDPYLSDALPYIVTVSLLAVFFLLSFVLLVYLLRMYVKLDRSVLTKTQGSAQNKPQDTISRSRHSSTCDGSTAMRTDTTYSVLVPPPSYILHCSDGSSTTHGSSESQRHTCHSQDSQKHTCNSQDSHKLTYYSSDSQRYSSVGGFLVYR